MKETIKLGLILFIIAAFSGGILSYTNSLTKPIIDEREYEETQAAFKELIPDADSFDELDAAKLESLKSENKKIQDIYEAKKDGSVIGYTFKTAGSGYGGDVVILTGVAEDKITKILVLSHKETPSLGDRIEHDEFKDQFVDIDASQDLVLSKSASGEEIQAISGSTISSRATVEAVNQAIDTLSKLK